MTQRLLEDRNGGAGTGVHQGAIGQQAGSTLQRDHLGAGDRCEDTLGSVDGGDDHLLGDQATRRRDGVLGQPLYPLDLIRLRTLK